MKTLRAGNRTVLNQQCAEGNTTIEEKTAGPTPTTGSVWQLPYYVLLYGLPQPKYFFCKDSEALRGHKIFSLNRLKNCQLPKYILGGSSSSRYFSAAASAEKRILSRAPASKQKKKTSLRGHHPQKEGVSYMIFCYSRYLWRSPQACDFCSVHKNLNETCTIVLLPVLVLSEIDLCHEIIILRIDILKYLDFAPHKIMKRSGASLHIYIHVVDMYIYICVCVCVYEQMLSV